MTFILRKDFRFEAAHQLKHHDGKCARLHGHSYVLTVEVAGEKLQESHFKIVGNSQDREHVLNPKENMVIDYADITAIIQPFSDQYLDHRFLNETFGTDSPTSEYLARRKEARSER